MKGIEPGEKSQKFEIICYAAWVIYRQNDRKGRIKLSKIGTLETDNYMQK